jgi:hypothetical protein
MINQNIAKQLSRCWNFHAPFLKMLLLRLIGCAPAEQSIKGGIFHAAS